MSGSTSTANELIVPAPTAGTQSLSVLDLADALIGADELARADLLHQHESVDRRELAFRLKDQCLSGWTEDSARSLRAADCLKLLDEDSKDAAVSGCAQWAAGVAALTNGRMEDSLLRLDAAARSFREAGQTQHAAATQVSKLIALAMLGRYDEAVECGLAAREALTDSGDLLNLGKIEHNLGNIYLRREYFGQAEEFLRHALGRFAVLGDLKQQTMVQVNLAYIRTIKNDFRSAEFLYRQALHHAVAAGLLVNQADIEANLGMLALYQGKYDQALSLLESARGKFAQLGMPHRSASAEQELADAYLELNLGPEAAEAYDRAAETFFQLGMRAERAQTLAQRGRAAVMASDFPAAHKALRESQSLFAAEGNHLGAARVQLTEAQLRYAEGDLAGAAATAQAAEIHLSAAGIHRHAVMASWLRGEALRRNGDLGAAEEVLRQALASAERQGPPMVKTRCNTSLGFVYAHRGDDVAAEAYFGSAIASIEELRAPLPSEEFRGAFLADQLTPYREMMRLCLNAPERTEEALGYCERARSRALADVVADPSKAAAPDDSSTETSLHEELNWYYSQLNRPFGKSAAELDRLQAEVVERENQLQEHSRRRHLSGGGRGIDVAAEFDLAALQRGMGAECAVIEFALLDDEWFAFVITDSAVTVQRNLTGPLAVRTALDQFRFQIDSLRHGAAAMRRHLPLLTEKIRRPLQDLYHLLLAPVLPLVEGRQLVIVPHGELHYVPFHALYDGAEYLIEGRDVSYAPSAGILSHCLARGELSLTNAVLLGVADEGTPKVAEEVHSLSQFFDRSEVLEGDRATANELNRSVAGANVLHLACHGQFRPDNPLFSALRLQDEWLTARDIRGLDLRDCGLVILSACETGMNAINPGDELIGLARGFFGAGAASLLLSQWVVDDETTAKLMVDFYRHLSVGLRPAAALGAAQRAMMREMPHPFFWSPFVLMGRC